MAYKDITREKGRLKVAVSFQHIKKKGIANEIYELPLCMFRERKRKERGGRLFILCGGVMLPTLACTYISFSFKPHTLAKSVGNCINLRLIITNDERVCKHSRISRKMRVGKREGV